MYTHLLRARRSGLRCCKCGGTYDECTDQTFGEREPIAGNHGRNLFSIPIGKPHCQMPAVPAASGDLPITYPSVTYTSAPSSGHSLRGPSVFPNAAEQIQPGSARRSLALEPLLLQEL